MGARTFAQLVATHGGHEAVALALVLGEVSRLHSYSNASAQPPPEGPELESDNVVLPAAAAAFDPTLAAQVASLRVRHAALLAQGHALLTNRQALFSSGAAPRAASAGERLV